MSDPLEISTGSSQKLEYYSTLRREFEQRRECSMQVIMQHISDLSRDMISGDRFVVYECQKVYIAILKNFIIKEGTVLLTGILLDSTKKTHHLYCLEIITDILSRHCQFSQFCVGELQKSLLCYCKNFFSNWTARNATDLYTSCLYCLFKIFNKATKLVRHYNCIHAITFIQGILQNFKNAFLTILLNSEIPGYAVRRLMKFVCNLLRLELINANGNLYTDVVSFSDMLVHRLNTVDLQKIVLKYGVSGFTGQDARVGYLGQELDIVHVREWSLLVILAVHVQRSKDFKIAGQLLHNLDLVMKLKLEQEKDVVLSWLPDIFSDQDDIWIEVLLTLMNVTSKRSFEEEPTDIHNHWYFLQFITYTGFDHTLLLDLLTSPETSFLQYLTSYLKYMTFSWHVFKETIEHFENRKEKMGYVNGSHSTLLNSSDIVFNERKTSLAKFCRGQGIESDNNETIDYDDNESTSPHENLTLRRLLDIKSDSSLSSPSPVTTGGEIKTASVTDINVSNVEDNVESGYELSVAKISNGLDMIGEMYSDSEGSEYSCSDDEINVTGPEKYIMNTSGSVVNADKVKLAYCQVSKSKDYSGEPTYFGTNTVLSKLEANLKETVDSIDTESVQVSAFNERNNVEMILKNVDRPVIPVDTKDKAVELIKDVETIEEEPDMICGNFAEEEDIDPRLMDSVMGTLIRVRLKLEKLQESKIIDFNPKPLIILLEQVEHCYENS